jgi:HSP20 family molecular chaperone IbpA
MTTTVTRRSNPLAEVLSWFDGDMPFVLHADSTPFVRIEDYVEDGTYVLRAEAPGLDPAKDLEVTITGDTLTIRGERREETQDKRYHEISYGEFVRSVRLPKGAKGDDVRATYVDGVLDLRIPIESDIDSTRTVPIARNGG